MKYQTVKEIEVLTTHENVSDYVHIPEDLIEWDGTFKEGMCLYIVEVRE